jgi:hypothetical protein
MTSFTSPSILGEAMDKVRRQENKELLAQGEDIPKGTRQLWLFNPGQFQRRASG